LQALETQGEFCPEIPISKKPAFRFEEVNDVTWKLTNGDIRCGDQACGPMSLAEAKATAKAMVQGAVGDYTIVIRSGTSTD
jgi:hypothetical protein